MAKADIMAGKAYVSLYVKGTEFTKALTKAKKQLQEFGSGITKIGAAVSAMGSLITGSLTGAILHFASVGDTLDKMSARTGVSVSALSELGFAAEQTGTNMEAVEKGFAGLSRTFLEAKRGSGAAIDALKEIGLSFEDLEGKSPDEQFGVIADGLTRITDESIRGAVAQKIFGRAGRQLLPMLRGAKGGIEELRKEARELGLSMSSEDATMGAEITDAMNRVRRVIGATFQEIGAAIAPMAKELFEGFLLAAKAVRKFITENRNLKVIAAKVGVVLLAAGSAIMAIGTGFIGAGLAIGGVLSVMSAFGAAAGLVSSIMAAVSATLGMLLTPVGLIVIALSAGAIAWAKFSQTGQAEIAGFVGIGSKLLTTFKQTFSDTFAGIVEAIRAGDLSLAGQIAMVGLRLVFAQGLESISSIFGDSIGGIVAKVLDGDLVGAWTSVGSTILKNMAGVAKSLINIFTEAVRGIDKALDGRISKTAKALAIIKDGEGGIIKAAFTSLIPAKEKDDPFNKALNAIDEAAKFVAEATDSAAKSAVDGTGKESSKVVDDLKAQLAALRAEAQGKIEAGRIGKPEEDEIDGFGSGQGAAASGMSGRASAATNSLAALASMASSPQDRQAKLQEQANKKHDIQIQKADDLIAAVDNLGLFHA